MLKYFMTQPLLYLFLGGVCLSLTPGYNNSYDPQSSPQNGRSGVSTNPYNSLGSRNSASQREELAQDDSYNQSNYNSQSDSPNVRMGDWDFKENWRYHRDAYFRGETQPQVYREDHPYGPSGIGYDADANYNRDRRRMNAIENRENSNSPGYSNNYNQRNSNRSVNGYPNNSMNDNRYNNTEIGDNFDYDRSRRNTDRYNDSGRNYDSSNGRNNNDRDRSGRASRDGYRTDR